MTRLAHLLNATILVGCLSGGNALADEAYDKCIEESDGTNPAWAECGGAYVAREDAKLNQTWKKVFATTSGQTKYDLLAEQRAWVKYKEAACAFYANGDFGREGQVLGFPACQAETIAERTERLEAYGEEFATR